MSGITLLPLVGIILVSLNNIGCQSELMLNISQSVYEYCHLTNFNKRSTNVSFPEYIPWSIKAPCCVSCDSSKSCTGRKQPCCPDNDNFRLDDSMTCKYLVYPQIPPTEPGQNYIFDRIRGVTDPPFYMVDKCLNSFYGTDLETKCHNPPPVINEDTDKIKPVMDNVTHVFYSNIYCAMCNDLDSSRIDSEFFLSTLRCLSDFFNSYLSATYQGRQELLETGFCFYHFFPSNMSSKIVQKSICRTHMHSSCNETGLWKTYDPFIERACSAYYLPYVKRFKTRYSNVHCYMCNDEDPEIETKSYCQVNDFGFVLTKSFYSILKSPSKLNSLNIDMTDNRKCPSYSFYDSYKEFCRNYTCPRLQKMKPDGRGCVNIYDSYSLMILAISVHWEPVDNHRNVSDILSHINNTEEHVQALSDQIEMYLKKNLIERLPETFEKLCLFRILVNSDSMSAVSGFTWEKAGESDTDVLIDKPVNDFINEHGGLGKTITFNISDQLYHYQASLILNILPRVNSERMTWEHKVFVETFAHVNIETDVLHLCKNGLLASKTMTCMLVLLNESEYMVVKDRFIKTIDSKVILSETEFLRNPDTGEISVCVNDYNHGATQSTSKTLLTYISVYASFVCSILSMVCLLFILLTFSLFKNLRTVPGKINICLSISLFVAQTLQLFVMDQTQYKTMCSVFGILLHFFWLNTVLWMNLCSFNLFRLFSVFPIQTSLFFEKNLLTMYNIYACVVPLIFIAVNVLVSMATSDWTDIGYGGETVCYISSPSLQLYTFTIPVEVVVCLNLVFLVMTIFGISRVSQTGDHVSSHRNNAVIYLKLSTLTGACWVFGFFGLWTGHVVFELLFIFANASQGVFLMFSFVCNRRVLEMYRRRFRSSQRTESNLTRSSRVK